MYIYIYIYIYIYEHCLFFVEWLAKRLLASSKGQLNNFFILESVFFLDPFTLQAEFHEISDE